MEVIKINFRFLELRQTLQLSQIELAKSIGLSSRMAISSYETGKTPITDRTIKDVCREFNVNEAWLRTGEGEMFIESIDMTVDDFAKQNGATALELEIVKNYFSLSKETRKEVLEIFFKDKI